MYTFLHCEMGGGVSDKQLLTKIQVGSLKKCNSLTFFVHSKDDLFAHH